MILTRITRTLLWSFFLASPALVIAQQPQPSTTLSLSSHAGTIPVIQVNGRSYVDVEALARLANGSLQFQGSQVTLMLAPPPAESLVQHAADRAPAGFSTDFLKAGIEELTVIREWRIAIVNAVRTNNPVREDWVSEFRRAADTRLALVSAAASSPSDRQAVPLFQNQFNNMQTLSSRYVQLHDDMRFTATDSLDRDPLNDQVLNCAHGLASLAANNQFQDVRACH